VLVLLLVGVQFARAIDQNIAMARDLSSIRTDMAALQRRRAAQRRELLRLEDPEGAIPEIHDRLRMVKPDEVIIFVRPAPSSAP
jgi:cell division protein FtsB